MVVNDLAQNAADRVASEIAAAGLEGKAIAASVTDEVAIAATVRQTLEHWGRVDILVNNAGILRDKSFTKMNPDDFRLVLDAHLMGAGTDAGELVFDRWEEISNQTGEIVPDYGFTQVEREVASAGASVR